MYFSLRHKMKLSTIVATRLLAGESYLIRRISTTTPYSPPQYSLENPWQISKWELYSKLSSVGLTGQKVTDVLRHLTDNGIQLHNGDLVFCFKMLRRHGRNHHCIEILDWMEKGEVNYSYHALRLDMTCKVKGIDEAEKYFDNLPPNMRNPTMYGTLLNCYCFVKMTDKALALFGKMKEMNYVFNSLAFNNLMGHYIKLNQPEKVPPLIQEMKQGNIPLNSISYQIWIQCYALLNDLEGLKQVVDEIEGQSSIVVDWALHSNIASAFIKVGHCERGARALQKMEENVDNSKDLDRSAFHHMISLYASIGSLASVYRVWGKLNSKFKTFSNLSYSVMLQSLSKLDDIEELKRCLKEWEKKCKSYDVRLPNIALRAYLKHDMLEEAELLLKEVEGKISRKAWNSHVIFMDYYLGKRQVDLALRHMDLAIASEWKPQVEKLVPLVDHFKEEKDVDGAEELFCLLKKAQIPDSRAYLWLLQTYAAAGITAPDMRQRMEKDHVIISSEHEDLLNIVCPS